MRRRPAGGGEDGQPVRRRRDRVHDVEVASIMAGPEDDGACEGDGADGSSALDVVLVHGLGVSNRYLVPSLRAFAREHRVFAPDPGRGRVLEQAWRLLVNGLAERPGMTLIAVTDYPRVGLGGMLRGLRSAARRRNQPNLDAVAQRALIIHGGRDPLVSEGWVRALARSFPAASVVTVPDAPHGLPYSAVGPSVDAVHTFVDEVTRAWREDERPAGVREPDRRS